VTHSNLIPDQPTPGAPVPAGEAGWTFAEWSPEPSPTVTGDAVYVAQWNEDEEDYDASNFLIELAPAKTTLTVGETLLVDVMLTSDNNYTQTLAEIVYDSGLLQYAGHANGQGYILTVSPEAPGKVALRSVPSLNMVKGTPCSDGLRIVTLKFTVKGAFAEDSLDTAVSFASAAVSPTGGVQGTTTVLGEAATVTLRR
jgi:hypothetical protein